MAEKCEEDGVAGFVPDGLYINEARHTVTVTEFAFGFWEQNLFHLGIVIFCMLLLLFPNADCCCSGFMRLYSSYASLCLLLLFIWPVFNEHDYVKNHQWAQSLGLKDLSR